MSEETLLTIDELRTRLQLCRGRGTLVLGIERFLMKNDGVIIPDISGILDLSTLTPDEAEESVDISLRFLDGFGQKRNERFCVVLDD